MTMDLPVIVLEMLSQNYLFFNESDIAWNGRQHYFRGIQVNAPQMDDLDQIVRGMGYDDIRDYAGYFQRFLLEVEADSAIHVPRARVAPGIRKALPYPSERASSFSCALANRVDVRSHTLANLARLDNRLLVAYVIQLALDNQRCRAV